MRKSRRLAVVEQLAVRQEQECARALGACLEQLREATDKLNSLVGYEEEYLARKPEIAAGPKGSIALQNYVRFMQNLDQAVAEQRNQVQNKQAQLDMVKREWTRRYEKKNNLTKLIVSYRNKEEYEVEKMLQKEIDELVNLTKNTTQY